MRYTRCRGFVSRHPVVVKAHAYQIRSRRPKRGGRQSQRKQSGRWQSQSSPNQSRVAAVEHSHHDHTEAPQQSEHNLNSSRLRTEKRAKQRNRIQIWEAGVGMSFTLAWTAIALTGIAKLQPVQRETHDNLNTLSAEVEQLQTRVNRAWRKVELGLDSTQSETAIRESLNYVPFNQLGVVFEEPATPRE